MATALILWASARRECSFASGLSRADSVPCGASPRENQPQSASETHRAGYG